jgi:hypothetical protein
MPHALVRPFVVLNSKTDTKKKAFENRKKEIKSIVKSIREISKQEVDRTKSLWDLHKNFFVESSEQPEQKVTIITDDEYFKAGDV